EWPVFSAKAGEAPINATSIAGTRHAPAQERLCLYRQKGCLVSPIFKGKAGLVRERTVEQRLRVGARAGEKRHVVRACDDVYRTDQEQAYPPHDACNRQSEHAPGAAISKALGG